MAERGIALSLRTVERACAPHRHRLLATTRATVHFETPPGRQPRIDFGERRVLIGGASRARRDGSGFTRSAVRAARGDPGLLTPAARTGIPRRWTPTGIYQERWFEGMERAFRAFGGVPEEALFDNARALVEHHDAVTRVEPRGSPDEVVFNERRPAFRPRGLHP